jgi:hypothetical protein
MATTLKHCSHGETSHGSCGTLPDLERLCYFFGQLLEPADFRAEQRYFATLLSLLARSTAGWGVACGLDVSVEDKASPDCDDKDELAELVLKVTKGIGIDCCGRLIVLREGWDCRLSRLLDAVEREALLKGKPLYVSIEHVERPVRPTRGLADGCDPMAGIQYGRIRDESRVVVSLEEPKHGHCQACLDVCSDPRVLLASIQLVDRDKAAKVLSRPELRRMLARHELATITGVGWVHGGSYERRQAELLLTDGFGLRFSRPILADSLQEGVIDMIIYEGGSGRRDALYYKAVDLEKESGATSVTEVTIKMSQPESFQVGDRIHLSVRCDFLLDECCRALSGAHLGGGVPLDKTLARGDARHPDAPKLACLQPPDRSGPWRSGNGVEGGVWESWIKVVNDTYPTAPEETAP